MAKAITSLSPDCASGWIWLAGSLHALNRTEEAARILAPMEGKFPENAIIPYNLACYACLLGHTDRAQVLLNRALKLDNSRENKLCALADPDLAPLRARAEETARKNKCNRKKPPKLD